jgi:hypothetical protein
LTSTAVALLGEIAFGGKLGLPATGSTGHIHVQDLPSQLIIMAIGLAMASEDPFHGLVHLAHILRRAGVQHILHHRLFSAARPTEGALQPQIGSDALVHLHDPLRADQQADERISRDGMIVFCAILTVWVIGSNTLSWVPFLPSAANAAWLLKQAWISSLKMIDLFMVMGLLCFSVVTFLQVYPSPTISGEI